MPDETAQSIRDPARRIARLANRHAAATEAAGCVHPDVVAAIVEAKLPDMLKPGSKTSVRDFVDVCALLAEGCMSTGWCNFVWGMHNHLIALYPADAQRLAERLQSQRAALAENPRGWRGPEP